MGAVSARWIRLGASLGALLLLGITGTPPAAAQTEEEVARRLGISVDVVRSIKAIRGTPAGDLLTLSKASLPRLAQRARYRNLQQLRLEAYLLQVGTPDLRVPPGAKSLAATQFLRAQFNTKGGLVAGLPVGPSTKGKLLPLSKNIERGAWTWLGPGNAGGRTRALVIRPDRPEVMFAGATSGGIWRTDNGGEQWYPVDDFMANINVSCLILNPRAPEVMYAGTGEFFYSAGGLPGAGIFKSTDGGATWRQLPATNNPEFIYTNRLALNADASVLLAATPGGIYRSTDQGESWTRTVEADVADVKFHPSDPQLAVAGDQRRGQPYFSRDGGATWESAARNGPWQGRVELCYAAANADLVYASVDHEHGVICRSEDGGRSYTLVSSGMEFLGGQGYYDNVIWAGDPRDANFLLVGGVDLWRSTDGGRTLAQCASWRKRKSIHADHHVIVPHPKFDGRDNRTVYFGNDGGLYMTDDVYTAGSDPDMERGWVDLNNNYGVTQFVGGAGQPATGVIFAGAQDNGTLMYRPELGPQKWVKWIGGDGGYCAAAPDEPGVFFGQYVFCQIHRTTGANDPETIEAEYIDGQYWNGSRWTWKEEPYVLADARDETANFYAPFVLDPREPNRLLAGGLSLWRTNDARAPVTPTTGPRWQAIKPPLGGNRRLHAISAIAVQPTNSDIVWVGHNDGRLFRTADGTAAQPEWREVEAESLPRRWCHRIVFDPSRPSTLFAAFGRYTEGNLWKTTDGGETWTDASIGLPAAPVRSVLVHPQVSNYVYAGTEVGVFASDDGGETWAPTNEGPANVCVSELFWLDHILVAVTYGRGCYAIEPQLPARLPVND